MSTPRHWAAFRGPFLQDVARQTAFLDRLEELVDRPHPLPFHPSDVLAAAGQTLAEASALLGPGVVLEHAPTVGAVVERACADLDVEAPGRVPGIKGVLMLRVTLQNALGPRMHTLVRWPEVVGTWAGAAARRSVPPDPAAARAIAWAALALGDTEGSLAVLPQRAIDDPPMFPPRDPTTRLMFMRAPVDRDRATLLSWWNGLLDDWLMMMEGRVVDWTHLQAIGAVMHHRIDPGAPDTGTWIHDAVRRRVGL